MLQFCLPRPLRPSLSPDFHVNQTVVVVVKSLSSCLTLCDPMDGSLPGSSVHRIVQARVLEWVAISFSRDLPDPGVEPATHVSCIGSWALYH